jgi:autotransporter-associated beta strand protein
MAMPTRREEMMRRVAAILAAVGGCVAAAVAPARPAVGGVIDLGVSAGFTLSQPTVQTQVGTFDTLLNEYLLDTGASGIVVGSSASQELRAAGLQTVATYYDFGIGGRAETQVSAPYDVSFAGSDGVPLTLPATRIQTSGGNFAFYSGIAGMPLMIDRTVGLDLTKQADFSGAWTGAMGVEFGSGPLASRPHQYSVPLTMRLFPMDGQVDPADPLPVYSPLPFAPVEVQYGTNRHQGNFLVDTGAMLSLFSSQVAFDLGLDVNGDGSLEDDAVDFIEVAGVGGSRFMPVFTVDAFTIRGTGGVDLMTRSMLVGVLDIDPWLSGVMGIDVLNSGWDVYGANIFLGLDPGPAPGINRVDFDFRGAATTMQAEMRLTLNAERDTFASQGPIVLAATGSQTQAQLGFPAIAGLGSVTVSGSGVAILDAVNTVTGTTTVQAGSLRLATDNALFGSPTVVRSGGLLEVASGVTARLPSLTLAGGTVSATMLAVNGTTGIGRLVIASGTVTGAPALTVGVGGVVELPASGRHVLSVGSLAVDEAAGGRIDVGTGRIEIAAGGIAQADLRADLLAARNGGAWNGPGGIVTSAAPGTSSGRSVGYRVLGSGSGATIVAWAAFGDLNLDGQVNSTDIALITNAGLFGAGGTAADWYEGDLNYDGKVSSTDLALLTNAGLYGTGSYLSAGATGGALGTGVGSVGPSLTAVVPEPAAGTLAAAALAAAGACRRGARRARRRT